MHNSTTSAHLATVQDFVKDGRVQIEASRSRITYSKNSSEISIRKGVDGKWRYGYHSTYGNGSFVWGEGCDASGYVILDRGLIRKFDSLLSR